MNFINAADDISWHTLEIPDVIGRLESNFDRGLSEEEAARRMLSVGPNTIHFRRHRPVHLIFLSQFQSIIVLLLFVAAGLSFFTGDSLEGGAILVVIVLNTCIGFFTEWKAERSLTALKKELVARAQVVRGRQSRSIPAAALVPGDIVLLSAGDKVPADGRVIEAARLRADEAVLTGESEPAAKSSDVTPDPSAALGDRRNMVYFGTTLTDGRGKMIVTETGARSEAGKIGALLEEAESPETPFEIEIRRLGNSLIIAVAVLCAVIILAGWLRGINLAQMFSLGISLAVAAIPEGLPAVTTMTLAVGMQRMLRMGSIIRRLPAVETLGSVTVICTDKTGTLTKNEMTARKLTFSDREIDISRKSTDLDPRFRLALVIGGLCNDARRDLPQDTERILGDPTEAALMAAAERQDQPIDELRRSHPRIDEVPFDSQTKRMVTVNRRPDGKIIAYMKGSPGTLISLSTTLLEASGPRTLTEADREQLIARNSELAGSSMRVLAVAYRELSPDFSPTDLEREYTFVALVSMSDPLRDEAKDAIDRCRKAGTRVIMLTGDQPATAAAVGRELGLTAADSTVVLGRELDQASPEAQQKMVSQSAIFARVAPRHKLQIVSALQASGEVVAMTGDGVNDAPALKQADIGIAMGTTGTEVAKESAAMVITDDNFVSIVKAMEQGRIVYANVRKFVHYLFSCNLAEILTVFIAVIIGWPLPLNALQILWLNMFTDVFPAAALALEPSAPHVMTDSPRKRGESMFNRPFFVLVSWQGVMLAAVTLISFAATLYYTAGHDPQRASTVAFFTLGLSQVAHAFNVRSRYSSILSGNLAANVWLIAAAFLCVALQIATVFVPTLKLVLHLTSPDETDWIVIATCSLAPLGIVELSKAWVNRRSRTG